MKVTTYLVDYSENGYVKAASTIVAFKKKYPESKVDFKKNQIQVTDGDNKIIFKFVKSGGNIKLETFVKKYFR